MRFLFTVFGVFVGLLIVLLTYSVVATKYGECAYNDGVIHYAKSPAVKLFGIREEWAVTYTLDGQDLRVESQDSATAFETIHILIDRRREEPIISEAPWLYASPTVDQVYYGGCLPITVVDSTPYSDSVSVVIWPTPGDMESLAPLHVDTISCDHDFACGEIYPAHCPLLDDPHYFESQIPDCPLLDSE